MEDKKFYLTQDGLARIKKEYEALRELKFAKARGESPEFLSSEDLNPEYLAFQEDMGFLEVRLLKLENIIKNASLIKPSHNKKNGVVDLGAQVVVEVNGQQNEFTLVGSLEADPSVGKISNESPVGKALLGRRVGEEIAISSPSQTIYRIKGVRYGLA
jgi:transcription elongation factor GreA